MPSRGRSAPPDGGAVQGRGTFIAYGEHIYQMMGYAAQGAWSGASRLVAASIGSFQRETSAAILAVQPARLEIVELPRAMTFSQFAQAYPSSVPLEEISRINRALTDESYPAGTLLKRVVGGELP